MAESKRWNAKRHKPSKHKRENDESGSRWVWGESDDTRGLPVDVSAPYHHLHYYK